MNANITASLEALDAALNAASHRLHKRGRWSLHSQIRQKPTGNGYIAGYWWTRLTGNTVYDTWIGSGTTPDEAVAKAVAALAKAGAL